ncbi:MAG: thioredoxin family protein [Sphingorhabdus sp.]
MIIVLAMLMLSPVSDVRPDASAPQSAPAKDRYDTVAFDPAANAQYQLETKLNDAKNMDRKLLVIMGGNWCHDSAALANLIDTPRLAGMIAQNYEVLFVDVGVPQTGKGRNLDIAKRFGIKKVKGTPTVLVLSPDGQLLNSKKDAASWRNAASRSDDDIFRYFAEFKPSTN